MNQMLKIYLLWFNFAKKLFYLVRKKIIKKYTFSLVKIKLKIDQTNSSIVHYYDKFYYESLNIFVVQNLY